MVIERWELDQNLEKELREHYKTNYSLSLVNLSAMDIARAFTFDGLANSVTVEELLEFLGSLNKEFLGGKVQGVGLEIGSGPGTFIGALANLPQVRRVYGVEACEAIVRSLATKVVEFVAGSNSDKVVSAVGDFNNIQLPDNSVDFIFDFFSLHHSSNPGMTLRELSRVLKPGGAIVCIDKARANRMTVAELDGLLNTEYSEEWRKTMGLSPQKKHTRRMNGEYEYRLSDWNKYFTSEGFTTITHYNVARIGGILPVRIIKRLLAMLPIAIQSRISGLVSKKITNNLEPSNRIFTKLLPSYPRDFSLIIAYKK